MAITDRPLRVAALSGSLRQASFNTAVLRAAVELAPPELKLDLYDLRPLPFYDEDLKARGFPPSVVDLRDRIRQSDGVLIAAPEYNRSISAVLKNAIDWVSRAPDQPFDGKPVAIMTASGGTAGALFANHHVRQILVYLNATMLNGPEVAISHASAKFDAEGRLVDDATRNFIRDHLIRFAELIRRHHPAR